MSDPVDAWLDGTADEAACAALAERMRSDPALARRLVDGARDSVLIGVALGRRPDLAARVVAGLRGGASRVRLRQAVMREVRARRPRAPRWPWALAAAAVLMLGGILLVVASSDQRPATSDQQPTTSSQQPAASDQPVAIGTLLIPGDATLLRDGSARPAVVGMALLPGDRLRGAATIDLAGARLGLESGCELALGDADRCDLAAGRLSAEVAPRQPGHAFAIATPQATATVVGTAFSLAVGADRTRLEVAHGLVRLANARGGVAVAAGESAEAEADAAPAAWRGLFTDFPAWVQQHGSWTSAGGVVRTAGDGKARILSPGPHQDLELTCRLRIRDAELAEIQVGDYNWFVEIPAAAGWVEVRLRQRGATLTCTADGAGLRPQAGAGAPPRPGPLSFYVRGGSLEIADARIRE